jgi:genome maintenance exonuclease 1
MAWKLSNKFVYPSSTRSLINGKRHYDVDGDKYVSVTSILSATKDQKDIDALNKWKRDLGYTASAAISRQSSNRGTEMHSWIESILLLRANGELLDEINLPKKMAETIIENGINNKINEVYGCEAVLYYDGDYKFAGTADAVINSSENKIKILDFKQSNKPKRREYSVITEYGHQLALYSIAHDKMFGTNIESTEILMCTPNLMFQNFEFKGEEFQNLKREAMNRVEQYYLKKKNNSL